MYFVLFLRGFATNVSKHYIYIIIVKIFSFNLKFSGPVKERLGGSPAAQILANCHKQSEAGLNNKFAHAHYLQQLSILREIYLNNNPAHINKINIGGNFTNLSGIKCIWDHLRISLYTRAKEIIFFFRRYSIS